MQCFHTEMEYYAYGDEGRASDGRVRVARSSSAEVRISRTYAATGHGNLAKRGFQ
jgi:hypothetical protein